MRMSHVIAAHVSQPLAASLSSFSATDEARLPKAVCRDFGKCAIVRFRFVADAAFLMFFFAAFFCLVEAMDPLH